MQDFEKARELAQTMVDLGADAGLETVALLTNMDTPLGQAVGNANEVRESIEVLQGGGPEDVVELTVALAKEMLQLAGMPDVDPAEALQDGTAMDVWQEMIAAQGGDPAAPLIQANETVQIVADQDGYVQEVDALNVGIGAWRLGAGRAHPSDPVDHTAGVEVLVKPGAFVKTGDILMTASCDNEVKLARGLQMLEVSVKIGPAKPTEQRLVAGRIVTASEQA